MGQRPRGGAGVLGVPGVLQEVSPLLTLTMVLPDIYGMCHSIRATPTFNANCQDLGM